MSVESQLVRFVTITRKSVWIAHFWCQSVATRQKEWENASPTCNHVVRDIDYLPNSRRYLRHLSNDFVFCHHRQLTWGQRCLSVPIIRFPTGPQDRALSYQLRLKWHHMVSFQAPINQGQRGEEYARLSFGACFIVIQTAYIACTGARYAYAQCSSNV